MKKKKEDLTEITIDNIDRDLWLKLSYVAEKEKKTVDEVVQEIFDMAMKNKDFLDGVVKDIKEGKIGKEDSKSD